jgi:predicted transcriptional regulator
MQPSVLLSIKPRFAESIFQGKKCYEFRRIIFKRNGVQKIVVYASAPICRVIGEFDIEAIVEADTYSLWQQTQTLSGITREYFDEYFSGRQRGYAIKIANPKLYDRPLELKENFNIKRPPQSFLYLL